MEQGKRRPNTGSFRPGKSGNPSGRRRRRRDDGNLDGWINDLTGLGMLGRDKTLGSGAGPIYTPDPVDNETALQMWRGDDISARVIETIPNEALRQGFELCIGDDEAMERYTPPAPALSPSPAATPAKRPATDARASRQGGRQDAADAGGSKDLQRAVSKQLEQLGALQALKEAMSYERAYGGGAILIGANDFTTDLREPLDVEKVRSLDWLTPLEPRELVPLYYYNNPRAPKFGQVSIYQLVPQTMGPSVDGYFAQMTQVHESRLIIFPGIRVSRRMVSTTSFGWGESVLTRIVNALRDFNQSHRSAAVLLSDFSQAVYKIKNLAETIAVDGIQALLKKLISIDLARSTVRAAVVDADGEDFERKTTSMSGLPETLDRMAQRLAAACDMPLTLLMGMSPAGLSATGESDIRFFYDRIASVQTLRVAPALMRLVEILLRVMGEDPEQIDHSIEFPPLWQPTEKEVADSHLAQAQADNVYLQNDVVSPEEMARSRFGGKKFSYETHVDFDARADQEAIAPPPVDARPEPPLIPAPAPGGINAPVPNESGAMPAAAAKPAGAAPTRLEE